MEEEEAEQILTTSQSVSNDDIEMSNEESDKPQDVSEIEDLSDENIFSSVTCLLPEEPLNDVIIITTGESLQKRPKRSSDIVYDFTPGEKKRLTNWIREKNNDRKAFPELFDDGKNGLDDPEGEKKISVRQNYSSKVVNKNKKYAENSDFIFYAQQHLERHGLH